MKSCYQIARGAMACFSLFAATSGGGAWAATACDEVGGTLQDGTLIQQLVLNCGFEGTFDLAKFPVSWEQKINDGKLGVNVRTNASNPLTGASAIETGQQGLNFGRPGSQAPLYQTIQNIEMGKWYEISFDVNWFDYASYLANRQSLNRPAGPPDNAVSLSWDVRNFTQDFGGNWSWDGVKLISVTNGLPPGPGNQWVHYSAKALAWNDNLTFVIGLRQDTAWSGIDNISVVRTEAPPVPLPAAVWLFSSAIAGFLVLGKRKDS